MPTTINYQRAEFLLSAAKLEQLPPDNGIEVAFVGRSNAGKSSALNAITNNRHLARVSKMPGRTQLINIFTLDSKRRLIDLPGYGFAKVPLALKLQWQQTLASYLQERESLKGLMLVVDIRHPFSDLDLNVIQWAHESNLAVHILLSKADKLRREATIKAIRQAHSTLEEYGFVATAQAFSATHKTGADEARKLLENWYE